MTVVIGYIHRKAGAYLVADSRGSRLDPTGKLLSAGGQFTKVFAPSFNTVIGSAGSIYRFRSNLVSTGEKWEKNRYAYYPVQCATDLYEAFRSNPLEDRGLVHVLVVGLSEGGNYEMYKVLSAPSSDILTPYSLNGNVSRLEIIGVDPFDHAPLISDLDRIASSFVSHTDEFDLEIAKRLKQHISETAKIAAGVNSVVKGFACNENGINALKP